ncbi:MAG: GtrA family protein [Pseudoclavibacter sp.]
MSASPDSASPRSQAETTAKPQSGIRRLIGATWRFLAVGALSSSIEIASFNVLMWLGLGPVWAKVVATAISTVNAYFGNRQWAFGSREHRRRGVEIALFLGVNAVCLALGAALVWVGIELAQVMLSRTVGPFVINIVNIISIGLTTIVRFGLYHWLVFPRREQAPQADPADVEIRR